MSNDDRMWDRGWGFHTDPDAIAFHTPKENKTFKEYRDLGEKEAQILLLEVEGDMTSAEDVRSTIEKLEIPKLGMSAIFTMEEFARRFR